MEQTVEELELCRFRAMVAGDVETLSRLFADKLVYAHSSGGRDTKASLLGKIESGQLDYVAIENPDMGVAVVGQTAVVTGRMVAEVRVGNETRHLNNLSLSVWTFDDGRWLFLAFQPAVPA